MTSTHDTHDDKAVGDPPAGGTADALAGGVAPVDEPPRPASIRRPADAMQFLVALGGVAVVLLLTNLIPQTTHGLNSDIAGGTARAPHLLQNLATQVSSFGVLAVPVAFAIDRLWHRDGLRVAIGLLAAVVALVVTVLLDDWSVPVAPGNVLDSLIWGDSDTAPVHTDIAPVIAFVTAVRPTGRPRWQLAIWTMIGLAALTGLTSSYASVAALAATYFLGRAIGYGTLYTTGTPNPRPPGSAVMVALRRVGLIPERARRLDDRADDVRRYRVLLAPDSTTGSGAHPGTAAEADSAPEADSGTDSGAGAGSGTGAEGGAAGGRWLEVTVLDRDQQSAGLLYRIWRVVRLRGRSTRRAVRSLRRSLEQESLMAYAVSAAGARTPNLLATSEIGTEAALLAYTYVPGRLLPALPDDEVTDELLGDIWRQLRKLQTARLAHRRLEAEAILVGDDGTAGVVDLRAGEIASGDLVLRIDLAQLLTTLALRVGPERAVGTAAAVLGVPALAATVPLLQRVALTRATRAALRRDRELLTRIREQIVRLEPETAAAPLRLERFRPRTIVSIVALTIAGYILVPRIGNIDLPLLVARAEWWWVAVGVTASALTYPAAAMMVVAFVPERLALGRTVLAQLAASFVKLVAPAAVTGMALNTRYLQRAGIRPGPAMASVGASQAMGMGTHILLLLVFAFISGSSADAAEFAPSRTVVIVLLAVAVAAGLMATIPAVRRVVGGRLRALFSGVVPRLMDVLQSPRKMAIGMGGTLMLTAAFVLCLDASIRAFGGSLSWTAIVVVFLTGNALGSAAPTPGGLGAVEGALTLGLTLSGLPAETATSAVLLYRLLTFWLPVLPGWAAFAYLQRREAI